MSRPLKDGLDYFPLDVDIDNDDKFQMLEAKYGNDGFTVIIKVMMWIYANSYYRYYGENESLLLIKRVNVDINRINVIINDAIEWDIFDKKLFSKYKILTSNGIQKRYWGAVSRRIEVKIIKEYWIYEPYKVLVSANIKLINVNNNRKSRVEYSRVDNKSRVESIIVSEELFSYWNSLNIIVHKSLTDEFKKDIEKALTQNSIEEIKLAAERYAKMLHDGNYEFCSYEWGLHEFLTRAEGYKRFLDDGSKWLNYLNRNDKNKKSGLEDFSND